ncbi:MarR family transcriptional regulator [Actinomadura craniellae]|uniref:MarR family transcriptional regulator n=1 Tax=Actinomadura craniellae TaxID=2231787 RepID=A0A365GYP8_9ACTN|nr:MarR family transcriptional regulator [Actinomadura craniellae]RAY11959.1 MarR family transcriptional regulator [Actinomadura craniellae]
MEHQDRVDEVMDAWRTELPEVATLPLELAERVRMLAVRCDAAAHDVLSPHGVTYAEFEVLAALRRARPPHRLKPSELARRSMLSSGGTSNALLRLTAIGLAERAPDPTDGRSSWVSLTPKGAALTEDLARATTAAYTRLFGDLPPDTAGRLATVLRTALHTLPEPAG